MMDRQNICCLSFFSIGAVMALNWLAAVKLIPWADVAAATPSILKGARNLWSRARKSGDAEVDGIDSEAAYDGSLASINRLVARVNELETEQRSASSLINALAEQNAQLVAAVALLRVRTRLLIAVVVLSVLAIIALWLR
jgi:hypothetical protein